MSDGDRFLAHSQRAARSQAVLEPARGLAQAEPNRVTQTTL